MASLKDIARQHAPIPKLRALEVKRVDPGTARVPTPDRPGLVPPVMPRTSMTDALGPSKSRP